MAVSPHIPVALALLIGGVGCGREIDRADGRSAGASAATPPVPVEREALSEADEAELRTLKLEARDTPLAVGAKAPAFEGLPSQRRTVIVFFRGEW